MENGKWRSRTDFHLPIFHFPFFILHGVPCHFPTSQNHTAPLHCSARGVRPRSMQESSTKKIYDVHSMFYDATFGRLVKRRIERAINHMNIAQTDRVLDLGIGTGVSLNFYPPDRGRIVGVDL